MEIPGNHVYPKGGLFRELITAADCVRQAKIIKAGVRKKVAILLALGVTSECHRPLSDVFIKYHQHRANRAGSCSGGFVLSILLGVLANIK